MTRTQACRILGIDEDADRKEVKKKYRKLMHLVHPDAGVAENALYRYTAQEINEAYAVLYKREAADVPKRSRTAAKKKQQPPQWEGLGTRWKLFYLFPEEVLVLRENAAQEALDG